MTTRTDAMLERIAGALELVAIERAMSRMPSCLEQAAQLRSIASAHIERITDQELLICDVCGGQGTTPPGPVLRIPECSECRGTGLMVNDAHAATDPPPSEPSAP
jgi:hypothetical protein